MKEYLTNASNHSLPSITMMMGFGRSKMPITTSTQEFAMDLVLIPPFKSSLKIVQSPNKICSIVTMYITRNTSSGNEAMESTQKLIGFRGECYFQMYSMSSQTGEDTIQTLLSPSPPLHIKRTKIIHFNGFEGISA
jgi:hypothetical protein